MNEVAGAVRVSGAGRLRVLPSGSAAVLVELDGLQQVLALYGVLRDHAPAGVTDLIPAAATVLLAFDPAVTDAAAMERAVDSAWRRVVDPGCVTAGGDVEPEEAAVVQIGVHYDGEDLAEVARMLDCTTDDVITAHTGTQWTVAFCGFAPGFGYCTSGLGWDIPRRSTPRTRVPAGSVALAGGFSAVYPLASPGGWQLIGRTQRVMLDLDAQPPALLAPGVAVRFHQEG